VQEFTCSGSRSFRCAYSFVILKRRDGTDDVRETATGSKATRRLAATSRSG